MKLRTRLVIVAALAVSLSLCLWGTALARDSYLAVFNSLYGTQGSRLDDCNLCHTSSNPYYGDFAARPHSGGNTATAFSGIESLDSDGDGYSNIDEITAGTFPGDPGDYPSPPPPPPPTPPATILVPNGGEIIPSGSVFTIRWEAVPEAATFRLAYSTDRGATWKKIASDLTGTGYDWNVPVPAKNVSALVRITAYDTGGKSLRRPDASDRPFTIEVVRVTAPKKGASLSMRTSYTITWLVNATQRPVDSINLLFSVDAGMTWKPIVTLSGDQLSYDWAVPAFRAQKSKSRIKVILRDAGGVSLGEDASNGFFAIAP